MIDTISRIEKGHTVQVSSDYPSDAAAIPIDSGGERAYQKKER
jgi:hypothetical protein